MPSVRLRSNDGPVRERVCDLRLKFIERVKLGTPEVYFREELRDVNSSSLRFGSILSRKLVNDRFRSDVVRWRCEEYRIDFTHASVP